jgi:hypothetical protein
MTYTRERIAGHLGGNAQHYLPMRAGKVLYAALDPTLNPNAPEEILVGEGRVIEASAKALVRQGGTIPVFLKEGTLRWRFLGHYSCIRYSEHPDDLADKMGSVGRDKTGILYLVHEEAGDPSAQMPGAAVVAHPTHNAVALHLSPRHPIPGDLTVSSEGSAAGKSWNGKSEIRKLSKRLRSEVCSRISCEAYRAESPNPRTRHARRRLQGNPFDDLPSVQSVYLKPSDVSLTKLADVIIGTVIDVGIPPNHIVRGLAIPSLSEGTRPRFLPTDHDIPPTHGVLGVTDLRIPMKGGSPITVGGRGSISQAEIDRRQERAREIGQHGEALINRYFEAKRRSGQIILFHWKSQANAGSPYDFWIKDKHGFTQIEVKSTTGEFATEFFISKSELECMRSSSIPHSVYRVFGIEREIPALRICKDARIWAECVLAATSRIPDGVRVKDFTVSPLVLEFETDEIPLAPL